MTNPSQPSSPNLFDGQRVLVAGGSSGMGLALCRRLLDAGAEVAIAGRREARLADAADLLAAGQRVSTHPTDVTDEAAVARLCRQAGRFDHLVCTVADIRGAYALLPELELPALERAIRSKLIAPLLLAKHAAPLLQAGGSMAFTSGIAAYRPRPKGVAVAAVNAAIEGAVRALAIELAPVRVNAVSPGWVRTPIWSDVAGDGAADLLDGMARTLPVGRVGTPDDIAQAFVFLMCNGYTTGSVLHVEGGHRLV